MPVDDGTEAVVYLAQGDLKPHRLSKREYMKQWNALEAVERESSKLGGVWVFRGTRVPVSALFENLRDGATVDQFLEWFPGVERSQVEAVLDFELERLAASAP